MVITMVDSFVNYPPTIHPLPTQNDDENVSICQSIFDYFNHNITNISILISNGQISDGGELVDSCANYPPEKQLEKQ